MKTAGLVCSITIPLAIKNGKIANLKISEGFPHSRMVKFSLPRGLKGELYLPLDTLAKIIREFKHETRNRRS